MDKKWDPKLVTTQVRTDIAEKKITPNSLTADHACEDVNLHRIENSKLIKQIDRKEDKIRQLESMVDDMQGRLRRSTLVIKGVPEGAEGLSENWSDVENLVMSVLVKHLDLDENRIWIERAHRNPTHMTAREGAKPCRLFKLENSITGFGESKEIERESFYFQTRSSTNFYRTTVQP